ncbi:MAG: hypothetical protein JRJ59_01645 [Deltaproteobacteria bacterium]|nr:hypothetical protein [Deltaproteobacteria bacterium]
MELAQSVRAPAWTFLYLIPLIHLVWIRAALRLRPVKNLSLFPAALGLGVCLAAAVLVVSRGTIPNSGPGRSPQAAQAAAFLVNEARLGPADRIVAEVPDDQPLAYYLWRLGLRQRLILPRGRLAGKRIFILETGSHSLASLIQAWPGLVGQQPQPLAAWGQTRLWQLDLKPASQPRAG